jgi:cysteine desulfurase/selenocysteine lyase
LKAALPIQRVRNHERKLLARFVDGLKQIKGVETYGPGNPEKQVPVVSINVQGQESSEIAFILDNVYDIACRSGLHCSPMAHKTIGTLDRGAVRFSFSYFNTLEEIDFALEALAKTVTELT